MWHLRICDAVPGFEPTLTGGDADAVELCKSWDICTHGGYLTNAGYKGYVGYWPEANAVVVAHEGTDPFEL